jgi:transposase
MENYWNENITDMKEVKNIRMYKRYLVILKHLEGNSNIAIVKMISIEQHTVGDYIINYNESGLTTLEMKHSTGAARKSSNEQETFLFETVMSRTPHKVGFESKKLDY